MSSSRHVWTCLDMYGHIKSCMDMYGHVWVCLGVSGHVWAYPYWNLAVYLRFHSSLPSVGHKCAV